jgi:4'-phosphopantetheinyl transferase
MPQVFYIKFVDKTIDLFYPELFTALPDPHQKKALKFHQQADRVRYVLSRHLTAWVLNNTGYNQDKLYTLETDAFSRPVFGSEIDLNISHSGSYVLCATSSAGRVGIDIEKIDPIDMSAFLSTLHINERNLLLEKEMQIDTFYKIWTKKEAVTKANGKGLHLALQEIDTTSEVVLCEGIDWQVSSLDFDPDYSSHIAFLTKHEKVNIIELNIQELVLFTSLQTKSPL